jgi:hypothetical protein
MCQVKVRKTVKGRNVRELDLRTPSGRLLPF